MSQQTNSMQALVNKLNQMGNGIGSMFGIAQNAQTVWTEFTEAASRVINELQAEIRARDAQISALTAEIAKLRQPVVVDTVEKPTA